MKIPDFLNAALHFERAVKKVVVGVLSRTEVTVQRDGVSFKFHADDLIEKEPK